MEKTLVEYQTLIKIVASMDIIVEIQGMSGRDFEFIPKEVAVVCFPEQFTAHWIVMPPCRFPDLPSKSRSHNTYVTRSYHGLEWFEDDVTCKQLYANLREILRRAKTISTRGSIKAQLLREVTSREIIDLEEDEYAPSFDRMPMSMRQCFRHGLMYLEEHGIQPRCALLQAYRIQAYFNNLLASDKRAAEQAPRRLVDDDDEDSRMHRLREILEHSPQSEPLEISCNIKSEDGERSSV